MSSPFLFLACTNDPPSRSSADLIDLSESLQSKEFMAPYDERMGEIRFVLAEPGGGGQYSEVLRADLTDVLTKYKNFRLLNRAVSREAQAEWQTAARQAANRQQIPATSGISFPQYIVKPTLTYVEREIRSDGARGEWNLTVAVKTENRNTEGAVEVILEIVDIKTLETTASFRSHGLLYERSRTRGGSVGYVGGSQSSSERVPDAQAIRAAVIGGAEKLYNFLHRESPTNQERDG